VEGGDVMSELKCVDWPTSAGFWHCELRYGTLLLVEARERRDHKGNVDIVIYYNDVGGWFSSGWQTKMQVGGAKFTKVLEANPFAKE
jgi:hypothetical protein